MTYLQVGSTPPPVPAGDVVIDSHALLEGEGYGEGWAVPAADEESGVLRGEFENLWPLQLVDLKDMDMVGTLFRLLRRLPQVILKSFSRWASRASMLRVACFDAKGSVGSFGR